MIDIGDRNESSGPGNGLTRLRNERQVNGQGFFDQDMLAVIEDLHRYRQVKMRRRADDCSIERAF